MKLLEELRQRSAAGEHVRVLKLARQLMDQPEALTMGEALEVARRGCSAAVAMEQPFLGVWFAEREVDLAAADGDPIAVAVAASHRGALAVQLGDWSVGAEALGRFHTIDGGTIRELDRYRAAAWFNLGLARHGLRDAPGAVDAFQEGAAVYRAQGNASGLIRCLLQVAWCHMLAHNAGEAWAPLDEAADLLREYPDPASHATYLVHRAAAYLEAKQHRRALELAEEILTPGRPGVQALHRSDAAWVIGECALVAGHLEAAKHAAALAMDAAMESRWAPAMTRANDLRRRITEADGAQGM